MSIFSDRSYLRSEPPFGKIDGGILGTRSGNSAFPPYTEFTCHSEQSDLIAQIERAGQRGYQLVMVYEEQESGWKSGHQRELSRFLKDARKRRFEAVLVWNLDRLSREGPLAILTLVNRLKSYGVRVLSYQESWTEAPGELCELFYAIVGRVAKMESQRRSERTKAGLVRAITQRRKLGRPQGSKDTRKRKKRRRRFL